MTGKDKVFSIDLGVRTSYVEFPNLSFFCEKSKQNGVLAGRYSIGVPEVRSDTFPVLNLKYLEIPDLTQFEIEKEKLEIGKVYAASGCSS